MLKIKDNVDLKELENISLNDFINYVKKVRNDEITSVAPLGFSGENYIVFENKNKSSLRSCELSFRKYCNECELLITDYEGNFLTYSKLNFCFDDEFIGTNFYNLFLQLKPYMNKVIKKIDEPINFDKVKFSIGFEMIDTYMKTKAGLVEKVKEE